MNCPVHVAAATARTESSLITCYLSTVYDDGAGTLTALHTLERLIDLVQSASDLLCYHSLHAKGSPCQMRRIILKCTNLHLFATTHSIKYRRQLGRWNLNEE
jgi:hypothetical protein